MENICLSFGDLCVLRDFSLDIAPGSVTAIMGESGAGKTTVLNLAMGLLKPDSGALYGFEGLKMAAIFQEDRLIEHMDAVSNILLTAPKSVGRAQALNALDALGLSDCAGKPVSHLSGGQRRRVAVARAMLAGAELLLLDEPFRGLDELSRARTADFIRERTNFAAVLLVTHDKEDAHSLCADKIVYLS